MEKNVFSTVSESQEYLELSTPSGFEELRNAAKNNGGLDGGKRKRRSHKKVASKKSSKKSSRKNVRWQKKKICQESFDP